MQQQREPYNWINKVAAEPVKLYDERAEVLVLGSLFLEPEMIIEISTTLTPGDFFIGAWGEVYDAMLALYRDGIRFNNLLVREKLKEMGKWGRAEGKVNDKLLLELFAGELTTSNPFQVAHYSKIVSDLATRRQVVETASILVQNAYDPTTRLDDLIPQYKIFLDEAFKRNMSAISIDDKTLLKKEFRQMEEVIPGLLPEGLTLLVALPKIGKSWLAMSLSIAVAAGGVALSKVQCEDAKEVLYLALEDSERRLQKRLQRLLSPFGAGPDSSGSGRLHMATEWRNVAAGGIDDLEAWMQQHPETKLIIVDTLQKIRPPASAGSSRWYENDYDAVQPLKTFADRHPGLALLVVHHSKKSQGDDSINDASGSTGLTGGCDNVYVMRRERGSKSATLIITGRDIEEKSLALLFDPVLCLWSLTQELDLSQTAPTVNDSREEVLSLLRENAAGLRTVEIASELNKNESATRMLLSRMVRDGQVIQVDRGLYGLPSKILI
jgi:hypothetical protein